MLSFAQRQPLRGPGRHLRRERPDAHADAIAELDERPHLAGKWLTAESADSVRASATSQG